MQQITQTDLIKLIEDKQQNAANEIQRAFAAMPNGGTKDKLATNKAYYDAYQDLICYIKSVIIVPDKETMALIPEIKQEDLKKFFEKAPITPYIEPKVERVRNDRFREFKENDGDMTYIDGKAIKAIQVDKEDDGYITLGLEKGGYFCFSKNEFDYNDIVAWWKYWKQN